MARAPRKPAQYRADVRRAARGFKGAATLTRRLGYDFESMRKIRIIAARNNGKNFRTGGSAMGAPWRGEEAGDTILNDAIDTGELMRHATSPYLLKPRVTARRIYMNVPPRSVPYIKYLGGAVMGWTPIGRSDLINMIAIRLEEEARSGLPS